MISKLTPEQEAKIPEYLNYWLGIGLRTETIDREKAKEAVNFLYTKIIKIDKPKQYIFLDSPMACQLFLNGSNQLGNQLGFQLRNQLWNQLEGRLESQLWNQLGDQLESQLRNQLRNQLGDQLDSQLWSQLRNQLGNQLWNQLGDQLRNQLRSQLWNQLESRLWNQLGDQLWSQLRNQLGNQLWNQLGDQLRNQLRSQLWNQLGDQKIQFTSESKTNWIQSYYWHYSYILNELFPEKKKDFDLFLEYLEHSKHYHHLYFFPDVAIFSDFPKSIFLNSQGRLDNPCGMALEYRDGYGFYAQNGAIVNSPLELELL